ncbi:MAG: phosphatase PAP2 family protein [Gammaproteobacteria bacterium]|nr:phosphatase PAP2 family protein [Gammaproteobacteria bacterium]
MIRRRGTIKNENAVRTGWLREARRRITTRFWLKTFGIPGFITLFLGAYFLLLYFPLFPVTVMPETALDRWIGFHPWAIVLYFSLWAYVSVPPALCDGLHSLLRYMYGAIGLGLAGMLVFLFWPTATPEFGIDWTRYPSFDFLKSVDLARNAFPSLHAAFAVFSGLWIGRQLREIQAPWMLGGVNVLWCLAILYATIATRQHVTLDTCAGILLGAVAFILHRQLPARRRPGLGRTQGARG